MITWLNLFEKYRVDRRVLDFFRNEAAALPENSLRLTAVNDSIRRAEHSIHAAERVLARYGEGVTNLREAQRLGDERLFLAYRYIYGLTMESTAAAMHISRDTVYRIRRRIEARGAVPDILLLECGISECPSTQDGSKRPSTQDGEDIPTSQGRQQRPAPIAPYLPCPALPTPSDVATLDVLAACFARIPGQLPDTSSGGISVLLTARQ